MKKLKWYLIPFVIIVIFIAIMTTGGLLKKPFSERDDVKSRIYKVKKSVEAEQWKQGKQELDKLEKSWKIVEKRVQFSVERNEMVSIDRNIARISGAIDVQDKITAIVELSELGKNWDDLEE